MKAEAYLTYIRDLKRYSQRTCEIYKDVLERYAAFADTLTPNDIRSYEIHLLDDCNESPRTVNLHLSVLSGYCNYLIKEGELKSNPVKAVPRPKTEKRLPSFYRSESMKEYFEKTQNYVDLEDMGMKDRYEARLKRIIVSLLFNTGIRRSELIGLKINSVDFSRRILRVKGKGDKMREIPLVDSICKEISLYLQSVETMFDCARTADSPLLISVKGKPLYPVMVDRIVKSELGEIGSITGKKSPHVLRHTLATELLNEGTDLNSIKELLGHSSLAATQVYTHNSIEKLKTVYNNAHPRAKSGGNYGDKN